MLTPSKKLSLAVLCLLLCALAGAAAWLGEGKRLRPAVVSDTTETVVAGVQIGGPFSLVDQTGKTVTEKSWPGKLKLVFFGFTHCPDICPAALQKMTAVLDILGPKAERVQILFVTVDPARDTPEILKEYVAHFSPAIAGLTGTEKKIKSMQDTYRVYAAKEPVKDGKGGYMVNHSAYLYLMSPEERALDIIDSHATAQEIAEKIKARL